ncbi:NADH-quinone oxidoreductase subunit B family protein [Candidatus Woesearchaeota archaeon]|nr:NADH-quinone oxidoreductase subunit B family protein [Candidatus Woesearchaeota archaeon]
MKALSNILTKKVTRDEEFECLGIKLRKDIDCIFGRSLQLRELDTGSDNATEIELVNLTTPYYDIERFGVTFVASPRHADGLIVTGAITHNMAIAAKKTYEAMPSPKIVIALGDDACGTGIFKEGYAVIGSASDILPVDVKIPGNPPSPKEILAGILAVLETIKKKKSQQHLHS